MTIKMKTIVIILSFILLFSCENKKEAKHDQELTKSINRNSSNDRKLENKKRRTVDSHNQKCYYAKLSEQFNVSVEVNQINEDSSQICIEIFEKASEKIIDRIDVNSQWLIIPPMFSDCQNVRSYSTGVNLDKEIIDNEFGDLIISDFNFDNLDDFAIAIDFGGNGGTIYSFYIQKANGKFELEKFLSETMLRFPVLFDRKNKTLTTSVHADAFGNSETVFQVRNDKWKQISEKYVKL